MKYEKVIDSVYDDKEGVYKEQKTLMSKLKKACIWILAKVKLAKDALIRFLLTHKAQIVSFVTAMAEVLFFAFELYKLIPKNSSRQKDRTYYDPCTGIHWRLKRPLKNRERIELERRRANGEFVGEILRDMNVLAK